MKRIVGAVASLFVDDGNLAIWIALVLALTGFVASTPWLEDRCVGSGFVAAVAGVLLANVWRGSR